MSGMQNKTIKKALSKKIEEWLVTIDCEDTRKAASKDVIVTGGSIASMCMGDTVNDYDVYFRTKETTLKIAKYYANKFAKIDVVVKEETKTNIKGESEDRVILFISSSGIADENDIEESEGKYRPVFMSENAITLSDKFQLVTRFYGEPEEIHRNYDFAHAMCYYDHHNNKLSTPVEAVRAMQSKTLFYKGSLYPICSLFRLRKFISRGWHVSAGEILKIAFQVSEIDLTDREVLREQLTGVDQLYFDQLYDAIKDIEKDKINSSYIGEVIDRMFGDVDQ